MLDSGVCPVLSLVIKPAFDPGLEVADSVLFITSLVLTGGLLNLIPLLCEGHHSMTVY